MKNATNTPAVEATSPVALIAEARAALIAGNAAEAEIALRKAETLLRLAALIAGSK